MELNRDVCYRALKIKDARFDGKFFVGVTSTGIYCRSVCKVTTPKKENCLFFKTAAEAEAHGFRPCLRCRPEMAPAYSEFEQKDALLEQILNFLEQQEYRPGILESCSERLGVSTRHIRRIFQENLGVSPKDYMATKRLLKAKQLLTDTKLPIGEIGIIAGFGSVSQFNAQCKKRYGLTPRAIRKTRKASINQKAVIVNLFYRPPYDWKRVMDFFRVRAIPSVEMVTDTGIYRRSLLVQKDEQTISGWLQVVPVEKEYKVQVSVSDSLSVVLPDVIKRVKKAFDLDLDPSMLPDDFYDGVRLPGCFDVFEMSCRAILGQQISVKAATTLSGKMASALGQPIETPWPEINRHFPRPQEINVLTEPLEDVLGPLGIIGARSRTMNEMAKGFLEGSLVMSQETIPDDLRNRLLIIKGIGEWTADYLIMRGLSWPDSFLYTDLVVKKRLMPLLNDDKGHRLSENHQDLSKYKMNKLYEKKALAYGEAYRPWRSYLNLNLWNRSENEEED